MQPRVLMIISFFYPHLGGAEQQALQLAEQLARRGVQVCVLTRKFKGLPAHETVRGVPVYRAIRTLPWGKWFALTYLFSVLWFLLKKRRSYDIIHCHLLQGFHSLAAILMKALFKKKVIIKVGATGPISDFRMMKNLFGGGFLLRQTPRADRLICVCSQSAGEALQAGFSPMQVAHIPNGVDIGFFKPAPVTENRQTITFAGRLDYMKGVHILLEGFKQLRDEMKNVQLTIIGDGPDREKLQNCAREKGISDAVNFCGEAEEIVPYLQQSAVFVLPSFSEGLSNVLLEAMACGLPVVATRVGGTIDLVQDGFNGILIEPDNAGQLYQAMKKILQDKDLAKALGVQARKTAAEKFSLKSVTEQYVSLYQTLVPARNR